MDGGHGRYSIPTHNGEVVMAFYITSPALVIVDHTGVPVKVEGHAAHYQFSEGRPRANGIQVLPLCPFLPEHEAAQILRNR